MYMHAVLKILSDAAEQYYRTMLLVCDHAPGPGPVLRSGPGPVLVYRLSAPDRLSTYVIRYDTDNIYVSNEAILLIIIS